VSRALCRRCSGDRMRATRLDEDAQCPGEGRHHVPAGIRSRGRAARETQESARALAVAGGTKASLARLSVVRAIRSLAQEEV
jgi:hypothetical protein